MRNICKQGQVFFMEKGHTVTGPQNAGIKVNISGVAGDWVFKKKKFQEVLPMQYKYFLVYNLQWNIQ